MSQEPEVERSPAPAAPVAATTPDVAAPVAVAEETEDTATAEPTLPLNAASILPRLRKKAYKFSCACGFAIPSSTCASFVLG